MKNLFPLLAGVLAFTAIGRAGPIQQNQISADARWVAHLDVDRFLKTQLGDHIAREFLDKQLEKHLAKLKQDMGVEVDWKKIRSVTVYGWSFQGKEAADGVLLIQSDLDLPATIDKVMATMETKLGNAKMPLQKIEENEGTIYQVQNEVYGASARSGVFVVTRTRERLLAALKVISGRAESLAASKRVGSLGSDADAFLVFGVADGFTEVAKLPKQAQILQQAAGARLTAGEKSEKVFVTVSLDTRTAEAATQIQQLVQGLIALGNLNGEQNVDLQKLAQAARVEATEKQVTLAVQLPVQDVIAKVKEANQGKGRKGQQ